MKLFLTMYVALLCVLSACTPPPTPSADLEAEIEGIREQIKFLKSIETQKAKTRLKEQDALDSNLESLKNEKKNLQDTISGLEAEIAVSSSSLALAKVSKTASRSEEMDEITLMNGTSFSAEIKEMNGARITIALDGLEKDTELSEIKMIRFRSGE